MVCKALSVLTTITHRGNLPPREGVLQPGLLQRSDNRRFSLTAINWQLWWWTTHILFIVHIWHEIWGLTLALHLRVIYYKAKISSNARLCSDWYVVDMMLKCWYVVWYEKLASSFKAGNVPLHCCFELLLALKIKFSESWCSFQLQLPQTEKNYQGVFSNWGSPENAARLGPPPINLSTGPHLNLLGMRITKHLDFFIRGGQSGTIAFF